MHIDKPVKARVTPTDWMRLRFGWLLDFIGGLLVRLRLHPNTMTLLGLAGNVAGAFFLAQGNMRLGGLIALAMGPVDALDGAMARLMGQPSRFGAFVDSTSDRYSELIVLFGLLVHYALQARIAAILLVFAAAAGSIMVSYVKARAEALGFECNIGLLTRMERYFVLAPLLLLNLPLVALWIVAVLAHLTALQRIWHIRKQALAAARQSPSAE